MIDLNLHVAAIKQLMELCKEYKVKELSVDFVHIVMDHPPDRLPPTDKEVLDKLTNNPVNFNEPWKDISDEDIEDFSRKGGF